MITCKKEKLLGLAPGFACMHSVLCVASVNVLFPRNSHIILLAACLPLSNNTSHAVSTSLMTMHYLLQVHAYLTRVLYNRRNKFDPLWNSLVVGGVRPDGTPFLGSVGMIGVSFSDKHIATGAATVSASCFRKASAMSVNCRAHACTSGTAMPWLA